MRLRTAAERVPGARRMGEVLSHVYQRLIVRKKKEVAFWILSSFLPTFIAARLLVHIAPDLFVNVRGVHIHHLTYGIILLAIAGYLALVVENPRWKAYIAALYGAALAMAFDEFGMWLHLRDDYWLRVSYDAVLLILAWLINTVYFADFWIQIAKRFFKMLGRE